VSLASIADGPNVPVESFGPVGLIGEGDLHAALARYLGRGWRVGEAGAARESARPAMVVVAADLPRGLEAWWTDAERTRVPWLSVHGELDRIVIGPLTRPGVAGCARCLAMRRASAARADRARAALLDRRGEQIAGARSPLLGSLAIDTVVALLADEISAWARQGTLRTDSAAVMLKLDLLQANTHGFLPDPRCQCGGGLPEDGPEQSRIDPQSRVKARPSSFRIRELAAVETELLDSYVDDETGLLTGIRSMAQFVLPVVTSRIHLSGVAVTEEGCGRTLDFRSARLTAIAEALERMGGGQPGGKRTATRGSYRSLKEFAIDPRTLGLYPKERHAAEGFPFQPYHPDLEMSWVWAHSFRRGGAVLVPERYAYYRLKGRDADPPDRPFVYEISNGCALGGCLEEAIMHGLLEIAERDAFLMTWFARMPVPRLDPFSARSPRLSLVLERIEHRTGYKVLIFNTTLEQGIPTFWVMAVDDSGDPDRPKALCAAGAALDPEGGVVNALQELTTSIEWRLASYARERERAQRMVVDSAQVRSMSDHGLVYCHEAAFERFSFLLSAAPVRSFADFREAWRWPSNQDLRDDLGEMVDRFGRAGLDVIVVDQTTAEHRAQGFVCVKTIVPGALPMTFGHAARRVDDLPRLLAVPHQLGYRTAPLLAAEVNPHPHPFP
jgi:ribosomal protein S12 methylthiotransferase accessory factor